MPLYSPGTVASSAGLAVIADSTLSGAAASFDVSGIAAGYRALWVLLQVRSSQAVVDAAVPAIRFNNDSGANYDHRVLWSGGTTGNASAAAVFADTQIAPDVNVTGDSAPAGRATKMEMLIPNYDGTTFHKNCSFKLGAPNVSSGAGYWQQEGEALWRSTSAITRITVTCGAGANWMTGSRITIFGV